MRFIKLDPNEDISREWDRIKFAALAVNPLINDKDVPVFCNNLLAGLLSGKYQAWEAINPGTREVTLISITRIMKDIGDIPYLLIDVTYGFKPTHENDKHEIMEKLKVFAKNTGCNSVITYATSALAANAARKAGMEEISRIYMVRV